MCGTAIQENKRTTFDDRTLEVNFSLPEVSDDARPVDEVAVVKVVDADDAWRKRDRGDRSFEALIGRVEKMKTLQSGKSGDPSVG